MSIHRFSRGATAIAVLAVSASLVPVAAAGASSAPTTAATSKLTTTPTVPLLPCGDSAGWWCGSVPVPIDRAAPSGRSISIGFTVFPHTDPASTAEDAVFASNGGPGFADTTEADRNTYLTRLGPLTNQRDLVLVDNRGTGTSGAINCPDLQNGVGGNLDIVASVGRCAAALGPDADRYGSGDVALDLEAVRQALGYKKISYYGQSYGSVDIQAYAVRFPKRLRAIVADAGLPVTDPAYRFAWGLGKGAAMANGAALTCQRAPTCAAAQPDARQALPQLARSLRRHPVDGSVVDRDGTPRPVHVDEAVLVRIADDTLNGGELAAAADALASGDTAPVLRLAANLPDPTAAFGDPTGFSVGDEAAAACNDEDFVWNRTDSVPVRSAKYVRALAGLPPDAFAPFSKAAWNEARGPAACLLWPTPDRFTPAIPPGATVRDVPTLLLSGDLDTVVPTSTTKALLTVFPGATFLPVAGAGHPAIDGNECARQAVQTFIRFPTRGVGNCATPAPVWPAVSGFPITAAVAPPATRQAGDASTALDRRVVSATIRAGLDCWLQSFRRHQEGTGSISGLRGGSFGFQYDQDHAGLRLNEVRFTGDVAVSGETGWEYGTNQMSMQFDVDGPGGIRGSLTAGGSFGADAPYRDFDVRGSLAGRQVHVSVSAN